MIVYQLLSGFDLRASNEEAPELLLNEWISQQALERAECLLSFCELSHGLITI